MDADLLAAVLDVVAAADEPLEGPAAILDATWPAWCADRGVDPLTCSDTFTAHGMALLWRYADRAEAEGRPRTRGATETAPARRNAAGRFTSDAPPAAGTHTARAPGGGRPGPRPTAPASPPARQRPHKPRRHAVAAAAYLERHEANLPEREALCAVAFYLAARSAREIAVRLGCSRSAVRHRLARFRRRLR